MAIAEPLVERLGNNPILKYFLATRPPFLLASLVPCLIGLAFAYHSGLHLQFIAACLTVIGALLVHAGANVLNDYYDALNGTDDLNEDRLYPFTGGSRFIQNGLLTPVQTARYGVALVAAGGLVGLLLLPQAGAGLLAIGMLGLLIVWAYSAPPLALNSRGFGEICVALGFGVFIPLGADFVQRGGFEPLVLLAALPYALLVTCLLYINQFPDRRADAAVGKRHWVVRLGPRRARWGYLVMAAAAYGALAAFVAAGLLPTPALLALLPLPVSLTAARALLRHAEEPAKLAPAIQQTIGALFGHGLLLSVGLLL